MRHLRQNPCFPALRLRIIMRYVAMLIIFSIRILIRVVQLYLQLLTIVPNVPSTMVCIHIQIW